MTVTAGVTIKSGGLWVNNAGVTILQDGLTVTGGLTVYSQGLQVTGGLTVFDGGLFSAIGNAPRLS